MLLPEWILTMYMLTSKLILVGFTEDVKSKISSQAFI